MHFPTEKSKKVDSIHSCSMPFSVSIFLLIALTASSRLFSGWQWDCRYRDLQRKYLAAVLWSKQGGAGWHSCVSPALCMAAAHPIFINRAGNVEVLGPWQNLRENCIYDLSVDQSSTLGENGSAAWSQWAKGLSLLAWPNQLQLWF